MSGGTGGDGTITWKDYVDAQDNQTRAQNEARFAEVLTGIRAVESQVRDKPGVLWLIGVGAAGFLAVLALLAFGGDRFDGGFNAGNAVSVFLEAQTARDADQDARLDRILTTLETLSDQSNPASETPGSP